MRFVDVIAKKRDGGALSHDDINSFVDGVTSGTVPDYQASALLMAIVLKGMTDEETAWLTDAMVRSGDRIDLSDIPGVKVGKHSTGGVGDKVSLVLAPVAAACGVVVPKMSGRGLGHTGGTLDKLESIPGFRIGLSIEEFKQVLREVGTAIIGQTAALAPADYTDRPARAATGRILNLYVDHDFDPRERDRIVSALRQWNHVLNGMIRMEAKLLPQDVSVADLQRLKRSGGWLVLRVDSRHRIAHSGEGKDALAVTVGGSRGGVVYVISDRLGGRDLSGVMMHEFGHVLGAGHGQHGLMAPVYSLDGARCIEIGRASCRERV